MGVLHAVAGPADHRGDCLRSTRRLPPLRAPLPCADPPPKWTGGFSFVLFFSEGGKGRLVQSVHDWILKEKNKGDSTIPVGIELGASVQVRNGLDAVLGCLHRLRRETPGFTESAEREEDGNKEGEGARVSLADSVRRGKRNDQDQDFERFALLISLGFLGAPS